MAAKEERRALAQILEYAKVHRDLSDPSESARWSGVVAIAYDGLGKPNMADIDRILGRDQVSHWSDQDSKKKKASK
jgi:hypothetical protein